MLDANLSQTLWKRDTKGKVRLWYMERQGNKYRTISGLEEGEKVVSEWTVCEGKNIGRANETTPEAQAEAEVKAKVTKQKEQGKYFESRDDVDNEESYVSPMLAESYDPERITSWPVYVQPKLNGMRAIAQKKGLTSRKGKIVPGVPHIMAELDELFGTSPTLLFDGELYNHDWRDRLNRLLSVTKNETPDEEERKFSEENVQLYVYDFPSHKGTFKQRETALLDVLFEYNKTSGAIRFVRSVECHTPEQVRAAHEKNLAAGYEGSIVRTNETEYEHKRTFALMKYKVYKTEEFEIAAFEEGKGNWSGVAKTAILWLPGADRSLGMIRKPKKGQVQTVFGAGIKGDKEYCRKLLEKAGYYIGAEATIEFEDYSEYGVPQKPIFIAIRDYE